jgi:hypothetical protein
VCIGFSCSLQNKLTQDQEGYQENQQKESSENKTAKESSNAGRKQGQAETGLHQP